MSHTFVTKASYWTRHGKTLFTWRFFRSIRQLTCLVLKSNFTHNKFLSVKLIFPIDLWCVSSKITTHRICLESSHWSRWSETLFCHNYFHSNRCSFKSRFELQIVWHNLTLRASIFETTYFSIHFRAFSSLLGKPLFFQKSNLHATNDFKVYLLFPLKESDPALSLIDSYQTKNA